jgi:hypothetical protein
VSNKRDVEAFGADSSTESRGAVTSGKVPKRGVQKDARYPLSDEKSTGNSKRVVRAFHELPRSAIGGLQQDHARGDKASRQFASTGEVGTGLGGVNSSGRTLKPVQPYIVPEFQGRSGQPDNQSTYRPKGSA